MSGKSHHCGVLGENLRFDATDSFFLGDFDQPPHKLRSKSHLLTGVCDNDSELSFFFIRLSDQSPHAQ